MLYGPLGAECYEQLSYRIMEAMAQLDGSDGAQLVPGSLLDVPLKEDVDLVRAGQGALTHARVGASLTAVFGVRAPQALMWIRLTGTRPGPQALSAVDGQVRAKGSAGVSSTHNMPCFATCGDVHSEYTLLCL